MRKLAMCLITIFVINLCAFAQIEMNATGDITMVNRTGGSVIIDHSGYGGMPAIYSNVNNCISVGRSDRSIYQGYFRYLWVNGISITGSDERGKKNKKKLTNSLLKVKKLNGYKYDLAIKDSITDYNQLGFMAQELMTVVPEAVVYDSISDKYGVNYIAIIPLLVEAIKEQQIALDGMSNELQKLKGKGIQKSAATGTEFELETNQTVLFQNTPNPFTKNTQIEYFIAENVKSAMLNIYNMNGVQLKSFELSTNGKGYIAINGNEFVAGMYLYGLIADGREIDVKRMILTK